MTPKKKTQASNAPSKAAPKSGGPPSRARPSQATTGRGRGGQNKLPIEHRRRLGNPSNDGALPAPDTVVAIEAFKEIPEPIRPLGEVGRGYWNNIWESVATVWLGPTDLLSVQTFCEIVDDYTATRVRALSDLDDWRAMKRTIDLRNQMGQWQHTLGLTPVARSILGVAEVRIAEGVQRITLQDRPSSREKTIEVEVVE